MADGDLDQRLFHALYGGGGQHVVWLVMVGLSILGSGWTLLLVLPLFRPANTRRFAVWLLGTLVVVAILVQAVKLVVGRSRPCCGAHSVAALWGTPSDPSFPSGHASGSFAFAAFMITMTVGFRVRGKRLTGVLLTLPLAAMVGVSRIYLGVHYPSDVVVGALLGSAVGFAGARLFVRSERRQSVASSTASQ